MRLKGTKNRTIQPCRRVIFGQAFLGSDPIAHRPDRRAAIRSPCLPARWISISGFDGRIHESFRRREPATGKSTSWGGDAVARRHDGRGRRRPRGLSGQVDHSKAHRGDGAGAFREGGLRAREWLAKKIYQWVVLRAESFFSGPRLSRRRKSGPLKPMSGPPPDFPFSQFRMAEGFCGFFRRNAARRQGICIFG